MSQEDRLQEESFFALDGFDEGEEAYGDCAHVPDIGDAFPQSDDDDSSTNGKLGLVVSFPNLFMCMTCFIISVPLVSNLFRSSHFFFILTDSSFRDVSALSGINLATSVPVGIPLFRPTNTPASSVSILHVVFNQLFHGCIF